MSTHSNDLLPERSEGQERREEQPALDYVEKEVDGQGGAAGVEDDEQPFEPAVDAQPREHNVEQNVRHESYGQPDYYGGSNAHEGYA